MSSRWETSDELRQLIRHFPPHLKSQVRRVMDEISKHPEIGKALSDELQGYRSYRIGNYRLIYRIDNGRPVLAGIGPRKTIYETIVLAIARAKIRERAARYRITKKLNRPKRLKMRKRPEKH